MGVKKKILQSGLKHSNTWSHILICTAYGCKTDRQFLFPWGNTGVWQGLSVFHQLWAQCQACLSGNGHVGVKGGNRGTGARKAEIRNTQSSTYSAHWNDHGSSSAVLKATCNQSREFYPSYVLQNPPYCLYKGLPTAQFGITGEERPGERGYFNWRRLSSSCGKNLHKLCGVIDIWEQDSIIPGMAGDLMTAQLQMVIPIVWSFSRFSAGIWDVRSVITKPHITLMTKW